MDKFLDISFQFLQNNLKFKDYENKVNEQLIPWSYTIILLNIPIFFTLALKEDIDLSAAIYYTTSAIFVYLLRNYSSKSWILTQIPYLTASFWLQYKPNILSSCLYFVPCLVLVFLSAREPYKWIVTFLLKLLILLLCFEFDVIGIVIACVTFFFFALHIENALREFYYKIADDDKFQEDLKGLLENFPCGIVFLGKNWKVLDHNKQASVILSSKDIKGKPFEKLFDEDNQYKIKAFLQKTYKKDLTLEEISIINENDVEGLQLFSSLLRWNNDECIVICISDISEFFKQRKLLTSLYKDFGSKLDVLNFELRKFCCQSQSPCKELMAFSKDVLYRFQSVFVLQSQFYGKFEFSSENFSPEKEVKGIIDELSLRTDKINSFVELSKSPSLPPYVLGDSEKHSMLIRCLIEFALNHCEPGAINLSLSVTDSNARCISLCYKISFITKSLSSLDLDKIFRARSGKLKRRSFNRIIKDITRFGVSLAGFDTLLVIMRGYVSEATITKETEKKADISVVIPFKHTQGRTRGDSAHTYLL
ncbi:unnamed protein product [Blepharisma stoltei]|uniref:Uncharacterized protein n=1 Tax=Blepharisma stoltei TaxID=1481888 RepID=A0AAU9I416_9CILI|nr:unnamed protein product [Blepharisma stoltei]